MSRFTKGSIHIPSFTHEILPDIIEICNLDPKGDTVQTPVERSKVEATIAEVNVAATSIRKNEYPRVALSSGACDGCGLQGICRK